MLKPKTNQFCNNCGKQGHLFNHCKIPITSIGIICAKREETSHTYLMICRKDSIGYIEFLRGKYPLYNRDYIQTLVDEMTLDEKEKILSSSFDDLWGELWSEYIGLQYRNEEKHSREKFKQIKRGINIYDEEQYDLEIIIKDSNTKWETPEWGFPKGRRNYQETDITCAYREFMEETGLCKNEIEMVTNMQPFEEIFVGSNFKSYKHKYYLSILKSNNNNTNEYQKTEVSDMKWLCLEDCLQKIRPYNLEKRDIIIQVDKLLNQYRLIS